ncbi:UDP-3-O-[3-hydroxymyristoyl] glucosamine N-acyltransferase [Arcicella aurantiaca]|uniref:UDP-3-O-acylglucosamine N-acyltransferase n=1 Tax=Arcicella aurantiaca TaxID=591202 RepID=A0A316EKJ6_9BACT|nr:UDP-3-O-(3-hydroxymyristoyl)glucosamine N-acyltransferase [Arcicella aurantiaca]PWK29422.1 UDP-3-O-[3-hydroxymyristoyl] glucosamine N-acyltransferase [Arcicella aurantiaca]
MEFTVEQIAQMLNGEVKGDKSLKVSQLAKIEEGTTGCISFLANPKYEQYLYTTTSSAVIVDNTFEPKKDYTTTLILVKNAYAAFTTLLQEYQKILAQNKKGIEQPSFISSSATIGTDVYIGAFAYVGDNCKVGNKTKIYPNVSIAEASVIGENCTIYSGVTIYHNTIIGDNCVIHANAVIGSDGFGFAPQADGTFATIPQLGNVVLENNVSIGANTTVDRATMGSTILRDGVKIDNLVQIAHNVEIGKNTVIAALTGISGSTKVGSNCMIGGQVGMAGHITVADRTIVTAQSGVTKTVKQSGRIMAGSPAQDSHNNLKSQVLYKNLPKIEQRLKEVEEQIKQK